MKWGRNVARSEESAGEFKVLTWKFEGKRQLRKPQLKSEGYYNNAFSGKL